MDILICLLLAVVVLVWVVAICGWLETRLLWNGGTCAENGATWTVIDSHNGLFLFAGKVSRRIRWPLVYGAIIDNARGSV